MAKRGAAYRSRGGIVDPPVIVADNVSVGDNPTYTTLDLDTDWFRICQRGASLESVLPYLVSGHQRELQTAQIDPGDAIPSGYGRERRAVRNQLPEVYNDIALNDVILAGLNVDRASL